MGRYDILLEEPKKSPGATPPPAPVKEKPPHEPVLDKKKTDLLANQQRNKEAKKQPNKTMPKISFPPADAQDVQDTSLLTTKEKTKYGTYLTDASIEKIRMRAIQTKRDDHQIIQEAINQYFERLEK